MFPRSNRAQFLIFLHSVWVIGVCVMHLYFKWSLQVLCVWVCLCLHDEGGQNFNQPLPDCMVCDIYATSGYIIRPRGTNLWIQKQQWGFSRRMKRNARYQHGDHALNSSDNTHQSSRENCLQGHPKDPIQGWFFMVTLFLTAARSFLMYKYEITLLRLRYHST